MKKSIAIALIVTVFLPNIAFSKTVGKWNSGTVGGFTRYWTTNNVGSNNVGSNFVVWCHPKRKINGTLLHIEIEGKAPPPGTRIKLILDQEILDLPVNKQGYIDSGCATCADSFDYVWHKLRSSQTMAVKFKDNSYAGFSLKGAQKILPGSVCPTDWEKKN
ncbi:MAG: hypothetical protein K5905_20065 [Roseibium sp.]|uniref:hypothetical protein n=1 Tax=Roseibium sp. TaxID=1936156 RepID=UPI00262B598C|nr:hypothetical protein [Roseibium sp.]MCV0427759.1 hypothetical protein [Roseibium sp.]